MARISTKTVSALVIFAALMLFNSYGAHAQKRWAVVNLSANYMREEPGYEEENGTQALMGTVAEVLESKSYWRRIRTDDYTAWTNEMGLVMMDEAEKAAYLAAPKWICTAELTHIFSEPSEESLRLSDFTMGGLVRKVPGGKSLAGWTPVMMPDSRKGWVRTCDVEDFAAWAATRRAAKCTSQWDGKAADDIVATALKMNGVPYMWGGTSAKAVDCSGLVKLVYYMNGISLPRNASQQAAVLPDVQMKDIKPGDLLFFGRPATESSPMRISHVTIWIGDGKFIHASQVVRISTLDDYSRKPVCIRRVLGSVGKPGVKVVEPASGPQGSLTPDGMPGSERHSHPRVGGGAVDRRRGPQEPTARKEVRGIAYSEADTLCRIDVTYDSPAERKPVIVWFHGGGLTKGSMKTPAALAESQYVVASVGYRFAPKVGVADIIDDAAAAISWVMDNIENYGGDPDRIFIAGHSAGAYLVTMVALDRKYLAKYGHTPDSIRAVISYSGQAITHFTDRSMHGIDALTPTIGDLAPLAHLRADAPPFFLISGDREKELYGRYEENAYFVRMMKLVGHTDIDMIELKGYNHSKMATPGHRYALEYIAGRE